MLQLLRITHSPLPLNQIYLLDYIGLICRQPPVEHSCYDSVIYHVIWLIAVIPEKHDNNYIQLTNWPRGHCEQSTQNYTPFPDCIELW